MKKMRFFPLLFAAIVLAFTACTNVNDPDPDNPNNNNNGNNSAMTLPYSETFASSIGKFTQYSVTGDEVWAYDTHGYVMMTGYISGTNFANEDWLISPAISLLGVETAKLSFQHVVRYFAGLKTEATVWISLNYTEGNPNDAIWEQLQTKDFTDSGSWTFAEPGEISLTKYVGNNVRIAFKYISTSTKAGTWEIKNFEVLAGEASTDPIEPGEDGGTKDDPFTVAKVISFYESGTQGSYKEVWVKGYIVGGVKNVLTGGGNNIQSANDVVFGTTDIRSTSVLIADSENETDYLKCVVIKLNDEAVNPPSLRSAVNLADNPDNLHKELYIQGNLDRYFGVYGIRNVKDYEIDASGEIDPDAIFSESFAKSLGQFTAYNVTGDSVWTYSSKYGAVMTGYANDEERSYKNEDWLISPAIDLTGKTNVALSFEHAIGPAGSIGIDKSYFTLWFTNEYSSENPNSVTWTQVTIPNYTSTAWSYVKSTVDVPSALENATNVRFAFKYLCTDEESATWEIKNVVLK